MTGKEILEAAKERLRKIAIEHLGDWDIQASEAFIAQQIDIALEEEREACAKIVESIEPQIPMVVTVSTHFHEKEMKSLQNYIAEKIRARSQGSGEGKSE